MILALPADVQARLAEIERDEGIPPLEIAHQAIAVWSQLRGDDERKCVGVSVMAHVMYRARSPF
ncbi:hypothetical protein [Aureimonas sp. SK2]|uniref:hypothetical protein n=1 Tax=Aureimonas sp. SK2 TaxID=3015992 RepID=UPI0024443748|nr:hypothetical protein [Aureimonas sp. SK2]